MNWTPADDYPDLTLDRLVIVGNLLRNARDGAANDHHPDRYETSFSLGVSAWERSKGELVAASYLHPWLTIGQGGGTGATHFIFQIGIYPIRFCHATAEEELPYRYRKLSFDEGRLQRQQGALAMPGALPEGHSFRIGIVTNKETHRTVRIKLIEFDNITSEIVREFLIPLAAATTTITPFVAHQKQGVEVPPPAVEVKRVDRKQGAE